MSYFEDYIEPYIGEIPDCVYSDNQIINEVVYTKFSVEYRSMTDKAYLLYFKCYKSEAWVPKGACLVVSNDGVDMEIEIPNWFDIKLLNEVKEITLF